MDYEYKDLLDTQGRYRTKSLFKESQTPLYPYYFTLKEEDDGKIKSLKGVYLSCADITEYKFAKQVFNSFNHWEVLLKAAPFRAEVENWRKELNLRLRSEAIDNIRNIAAKANGQVALTASRYILDLTEDPANKVGRPKKDTTEEELRYRLRHTDEVNKDYERLKQNNK